MNPKIITPGLEFRILFLAHLTLFGFGKCLCQPCSGPADTIKTGGTIVNAYTQLLSTAASGSQTILADIGNLNNGTSLGPGSLIMIIGMQGAVIDTTDTPDYGNILNYNSAGKYEFAYVGSISDTATINLQSPLANTYAVGGAKRVQVVRVAVYSSLVINAGASVTGKPWNGASGGIIAIKICNTLTLNGLIYADTLGFRGGALINVTTWGITDFVGSDSIMGAEKGEGIAGCETDYDSMGGRYCRGAPANGGGGGDSWNAGGGGGANGNNCVPWNGLGNPDTSGGAVSDSAWTLDVVPNFAFNVSSGGGRGGYTWASNQYDPAITVPGNSAWGGDWRRNVGGLGGRPLDADAETAIFLGGGGGAGNEDNDNGSAGGRGGGIVYIIATNLTGNGIITANGQAADTAGLNTNTCDDGPGGGGGGGTIIVKATVGSALTLNANGGEGGNQNSTSNCIVYESEGPGGGGGGGYIFVSFGSPAMSVEGGANGTTNSMGVMGFPANGATAGASGNDNPLNYTLSPPSLCPGDSALITFIGDSAISISPDNYVTWLNSVQAILKPDTTTTYTITAYSTCGSSARQYFTLPVINGTVAITANKTVMCPGDSAQICAPAGFIAYNWNNYDTTACINAFDAGDYYVTVTANGNCMATSNHLPIRVYPVTPVGISVNGDTLSSYNSNNYQWLLNGTPLPGAIKPVYIADTPGIYTVQVTDSNGCIATSGAVTITGVMEVSMYKNMIIFPNPAGDVLNIHYEGVETPGEITVSDVTGRTVQKQGVNFINSISSINIKELSSGLYFLELEGEKKVVAMGKFVKE